MDIYAINNAITELEKSETTYENVSELSALYIVREKLTKNSTIISSDATEKELQDILPCYKKYIAIKREYQLGKATEDLLLDCMTAVCKEISEFIKISRLNKQAMSLKEVFNLTANQNLSNDDNNVVKLNFSTEKENFSLI